MKLGESTPKISKINLIFENTSFKLLKCIKSDKKILKIIEIFFPHFISFKLIFWISFLR